MAEPMQAAVNNRIFPTNVRVLLLRIRNEAWHFPILKKSRKRRVAHSLRPIKGLWLFAPLLTRGFPSKLLDLDQQRML